MKIEEINGIYAIIQDNNENFWHSWLIRNRDYVGTRPRLKDSLAEWWDRTAPGEWTTSYLDDGRKRAIVIRDPSLFMLFKLAFSDSEDINVNIKVLDSACYYAPYVPLTVPINPRHTLKMSHDLEDSEPNDTSLVPESALQELTPVFKTYYDLKDTESGEDSGSQS